MNPVIQPKTTILRVIKDDKELYNQYRESLRERSRIAISIQGVTDEHRIQIENALQELLTAEVIKLAHDDLRARGIRDDFLDERGLRSSLEGVPLAERDRTILESKVRRLARQMRMPQDRADGGREPGEEEPGEVGKPSHQRPAFGTFAQYASGPICLCAVANMPGTTLSLSGDALRLKVEPGAAFGIAQNQMQVGLASEVNWAKEIYAFNLCMGKLASVDQAGANPVPSFMLLTKGCGGPDTIVFTKPQFGGWWADVSNFEPSQFWPVFGGMRLTFTWLTD